MGNKCNKDSANSPLLEKEEHVVKKEKIEVNEEIKEDVQKPKENSEYII